MSSVQYLREFVNERLTAAAEEIFGVFEQTIVEYEEEIDRQRRLLDIVWKPEIKLHRTELPQQHVCKEEEVLTDQQLCDQEDPELLQIKEEEEELCTSQKGEQLVLKQETDTLMLTPTNEESDHQLLSHNSPVAESKDQEGSELVVPESTGNAEMQPKQRYHKNTSHSDNVHNSPTSKSNCNTQTGKKSLKCDTCGKDFQYKSLLIIHLRTHTGERPYSCETCGKRFSNKSALKRHIRIHTGEKPYSCNTCGKGFAGRDGLSVHMRTHTGEKPYTCNTCGKRFSDTPMLKKHLRIHTGEKPFSCKMCGKRFARSYCLLIHIRTHTGEKPYACNTCGKQFHQVSGLKRHIRLHKTY